MSTKGTLGLSLGDFLRPMMDFFTKLLANPQKWWPAFKQFLREENPWEKTEFPIWRIVTVPWFFGLFSREVDLVRVSGKELGFTEKTSFKDIFARALSFGLKPCPVKADAPLQSTEPGQNSYGNGVSWPFQLAVREFGTPMVYPMYYIMEEGCKEWSIPGHGAVFSHYTPEASFVFEKPRKRH